MIISDNYNFALHLINQHHSIFYGIDVALIFQSKYLCVGLDGYAKFESGQFDVKLTLWSHLGTWLTFARESTLTNIPQKMLDAQLCN